MTMVSSFILHWLLYVSTVIYMNKMDVIKDNSSNIVLFDNREKKLRLRTGCCDVHQKSYYRIDMHGSPPLLFLVLVILMLFLLLKVHQSIFKLIYMSKYRDTVTLQRVQTFKKHAHVSIASQIVIILIQLCK